MVPGHPGDECDPMVIMKTYNAPITGGFVAKCPRCKMVCAYWDDEDLDDSGDLICYCEEEENGQLDV